MKTCEMSTEQLQEFHRRRDEAQKIQDALGDQKPRTPRPGCLYRKKHHLVAVAWDKGYDAD